MKKNNEFRVEDDMIMEYYGSGGEVIIPDGIQDIFFEVFYGNESISKVNISGSVLDIASFTFEECSALKEVILNEGVKSIGVNAFNCCSSLEILRLPLSISRISSGAFANCESLKEIYYAGSKQDFAMITKEEDWDENSRGYNLIFSK